MKKKFSALLAVAGLAAVGLVGIGPAAAQPLTFRTTDAAEQTAYFFADHTLGEVDGTLKPVAGTLTFDPARPTNGLSGRFAVAVESFDTGIGMRDRDMRKNYLEVEQYPEIVFVLDDARPTLLDGPASAVSDTLRLAITGALTLHGVTRPHSVRATLTRDGAGGYRVHAVFPLRLTDYAIRPPKRFMLKVADEIRLEILLNLKRAN